MGRPIAPKWSSRGSLDCTSITYYEKGSKEWHCVIMQMVRIALPIILTNVWVSFSINELTIFLWTVLTNMESFMGQG
jgi:hypothetical protein